MLAERLAEADPERALALGMEKQGVYGWPDNYLRSRAAIAMAISDPVGSLARLRGIASPSIRRDLIGTFLQTVAREDPRQMDKWIGDPEFLKEFGDNDSWSIGSAIGQRAISDPEAAARIVAGIPNGGWRNKFAANVARQWAIKDPQGALAWARGLSSNRSRENALSQIVSVVSHSNRALAIEIAESESDLQLRNRMASMIAGSWTREDPAAALEWIGTQEEGPRRKAFEQWLETAIEVGFDPSLAMEAINTHTPSENRQRMAQRLASSIAQRDPDEAMKWIGSLEDPAVQASLTRSIISGAASNAPRWAAQQILELQKEGKADALAGNLPYVATHLARNDPTAAIEWAGQLGVGQSAAMGGVMREWARNDPAAAAEYASSSELGGARRESLLAVAASWSNRDPQAALEWAGKLSGHDAVAVTGLLVDRLATAGDLETAATAFENMIENGTVTPSGTQVESAAYSVSVFLAATDRERALELVGGLEDEGARAMATTGVVAAWLGQNSDEAIEWVGNLAEGRVRDAAVGRVVDSMVSRDVETAFTWASRIGDEGQRVERMEKALRKWVQQDAAAVAQEAVALAPAQRERLEKALEWVVVSSSFRKPNGLRA